MKEIIISKNDAGQRIDKFITKKYKSMPFSMLYKLIRKKKITVNRKRTKENYILNEGDLVLIFAPDDVLSDAPKKQITANTNISVVYEDENIIIVDKEAGLLVHSDDKNDTDTLIDRITAYLIKKGDYSHADEHSFAPALCNRIDRNTEGLVIAAKNAEALREMNLIIKERMIQKKYLAVVHGILDRKEDSIQLFLEKNSDNNTVYVKNTKTKNAKTAITKYKTIAVTRDRMFSLLEIELITGRTHQIRATFAHLGHPLLGDGKYAVNKKDRELGYKSQALCAYSLKFDGCKKTELLSYLDGLTVTAKKPSFLSLF